ncbi:MAG: hypothetical protein H0V66_01790 [Bdellovibrionales bacterium]|nr:hypothetical protein [Bdellovibrionales bacterium]
MKILLSALFLFMSVSVMAETRCIAHQGSFKSAPPNSLLSFQEALDLNADGVEFDIQHTKDGFPIIMHDKKMTTATHLPGRTCPLKTKIHDLMLKDIRKNCGIKFNDGFLPVPLLEEALEVVAYSGKVIFIELKDEPTPQTESIIHHYFKHSPQNLRMISFRPKFMDHLMSSNINNKDFWAQVNGLDIDITPWGADSKYGTNIWNQVFSLRSKRHRREGIETSVWTLNEEKKIKLYIHQGVTFITTNEVALCLRLKQEI